MRAVFPDIRPLPVELRIADLRKAQCPRNRSSDVPRGVTESFDRCPERERASFYRTQCQQCASQHQDQTGGRNRAHLSTQVYTVLDAESRGILHFTAKAG